MSCAARSSSDAALTTCNGWLRSTLRMLPADLLAAGRAATVHGLAAVVAYIIARRLLATYCKGAGFRAPRAVNDIVTSAQIARFHLLSLAPRVAQQGPAAAIPRTQSLSAAAVSRSLPPSSCSLLAQLQRNVGPPCVNSIPHPLAQACTSSRHQTPEARHTQHAGTYSPPSSFQQRRPFGRPARAAAARQRGTCLCRLLP